MSSDDLILNFPDNKPNQFSVRSNNSQLMVAPALPWVRFLGAASFILISTSGILLNILLIISLHKGRKSFQQNAFFAITWQLIFCDLLEHFVQFIIGIPITLAGRDIYYNSLLHLIPCAFETFAYSGTLLMSLLMTINRITVFLFPRIHAIIFKRLLYPVIGVFWFLDIAFVVSWNSFGCYKTFNEEEYHFEYQCPIEKRIGYEMHIAFTSFTSVLPVAMFIFYVIMLIYIKVKHSHKVQEQGNSRRKSVINQLSSVTNMKVEFSLLAQASLICGSLEVENLVFNSLRIPGIEFSGQWYHILNFVSSCTSLLLSCIHPIVLFTFNSEIRKGLKNIRGSKSMNKAVTSQ